MALQECDIEQLVMNLTMPEVVTDMPPVEKREKQERRKKMRTREKIEKLVSDGAKNYPAYLKLVHTGDSDFSDNEEMERIVKTRQNRETNQQVRNQQTEDTTPKDENKETEEAEKTGNKEKEGETKKSGRKWSFKRRWLKLSPGTPEEKKDPVKDTPTSEKGADDNIYSSSEMYDNVANANLPSPDLDPEEKARQEQEWREELAKLEEEILTLRQVLNAKVRHSSDLKRKLGITPIREFQADIKQGFQNIKESDAYKKTSEKISGINSTITESETFQKTNTAFKTAGAKTSSAFTSFGAYTSKKLGDMRNSNTFKSFEERIGGAYSNVKTRMTGSQSEQNFGEALIADGQEMKNASASTPATPMDETKEPLS